MSERNFTYDNDAIRKQWNSLLTALPKNARLEAAFKISDPHSGGTPREIPISSANNMLSEAFGEMPYGIVERIRFAADYSKNGLITKLEGELYHDGTIRLSRTIGPSGETPEFQNPPRQGGSCASDDSESETKAPITVSSLLKAMDEEPLYFFEDWLMDFVRNARQYDFDGKLNIGGITHALPSPGEILADWVKDVRKRAYANTVSATLTRKCCARTDFIDILRVNVTADRKVKVEFMSQESAPQLISPKVIGFIRCSNHLETITKMFPLGLAQRDTGAFETPIRNFADDTTTMIPWPDRTDHKYSNTVWPAGYASAAIAQRKG